MTLIVLYMISCKKEDSSPSPNIDGKWLHIKDSDLIIPTNWDTTYTFITNYTQYVNSNSLIFTKGILCDSAYFNDGSNYYKTEGFQSYSLSGSSITFSKYLLSAETFKINKAQVSVNGNILTLYFTEKDTLFDPILYKRFIANVRNWSLYLKQ